MDVAFPAERITNTLGAWVARHGLRQYRLAETEKYPHVTFFLNGGVEEPAEGEERFMAPSPRVRTYDLAPEMAAEAVTPAFGVLGLGGAASFAIGAAMLIDTDLPAYQISWGVIAAVTVISLLVVTLVLGAIWRTRARRAHSGASAMVGTTARVEDWSGRTGHVRAMGERWNATGPAGLDPGETVEIAAVEGLTLSVARARDTTATETQP
jgi:membrane protein implicated in regulation of membrane protease activity